MTADPHIDPCCSLYDYRPLVGWGCPIHDYSQPDPDIKQARARAEAQIRAARQCETYRVSLDEPATGRPKALAEDVLALAARLEAAERENTRLVRDLADARKAMEFLANETLFGSIVAEYAQKKLAAAQHSTSGAYATGEL